MEQMNKPVLHVQLTVLSHNHGGCNGQGFNRYRRSVDEPRDKGEVKPCLCVLKEMAGWEKKGWRVTPIDG